MSRSWVLAVGLCAFGALANEAPVGTEAEAEPGTSVEFPRVHLMAAGGYDFISKQIAPEVGASYGLAPFLDLGLSLTLGTSIAMHLALDLHSSWHTQSLFRPFGQLRGTASFGALGFGGGLWAGAEVELGPGRIKVGPAVYALTARRGYYAFAVLAMAGYELDLLRPAPATIVERTTVVEKTTVVETRPADRPTLLRARLVDLDDKPVSGTLRFPRLAGRQRTYEAAPSAEIELAPGEYRVEADAPGYLVKARTISLKEGETVSAEFVLRPEPRVKTATLQKTEVIISQAIQFEFGKAVVLKESQFILEEVADVLLRNPQVQQVRVEGHTDDVGGPEANLRLSEDRALAVTRGLVELGVEANRLQSQGYGLSKPLTSNKTEEGRARNRRVQFKIISR